MPLRPQDVLEVPHRFTMGLSAIDASDWLVVDDGLAHDLREKDRLLRERRAQVFVELEASRPAQRESLDLLVDHLTRHHADAFQRRAKRLRIASLGCEVELDSSQTPPLETAARLVQEDLVVMENGPTGWCLTAAAVCFPTRWDLPSKLGLPMEAIHERVPGYAGPLSHSANRFFDGVKEGLPFQRGNWSLMDDPALHQPRSGAKFRSEPDASITSDNAGERVWLRREQQTLRRLGKTGAVLFTVRILQDSLADAVRDRGVAEALRASMRSMSEGARHYKSLPVVERSVLSYLDARLADGPVGDRRRP